MVCTLQNHRGTIHSNNLHWSYATICRFCSNGHVQNDKRSNGDPVQTRTWEAITRSSTVIMVAMVVGSKKQNLAWWKELNCMLYCRVHASFQKWAGEDNKQPKQRRKRLNCMVYWKHLIWPRVSASASQLRVQGNTEEGTGLLSGCSIVPRSQDTDFHLLQ